MDCKQESTVFMKKNRFQTFFHVFFGENGLTNDAPELHYEKKQNDTFVIHPV